MSQVTKRREPRFTRPGPAKGEAAQSRITPTQALTGSAALVALVSSAIALGFALWPSLKPDPGDTVGARVHVVGVERNVSVREWAARRSLTKDDAAQLEAKWGASGDTTGPGFLAYVRVSLHGFKRDTVLLQWSIYRNDTEERMDAREVDTGPPTKIASTAPADELVVEQPLGLVTAGPKYFVRVEIRSAQDGTLLDVDDSEPFDGL